MGALRATLAYHAVCSFLAAKPRAVAWHLSIAVGGMALSWIEIGPAGSWLLFWAHGLPRFVANAVRFAQGAALLEEERAQSILLINGWVLDRALCCGVLLLWLHLHTFLSHSSGPK